MVVSAFVLSHSLLRTRLVENSITVKGFAETNIVSDLAAWNGHFSTRAPDLATAYADLERNRQAVRAFLETNGIPAGIIIFSSVNASPLYKKDDKGNTTNEIEAYQLTQGIDLESSDVRLIQRISREVTSLLKQGIEMRSNAPRYFSSQIERMKLSLLSAATRNAKQRAEILAKDGGGRVGKLKSASQGVFQITAPNSTQVSNYGINDTSTIEKSMKAVVTVEYEVR